MGGFDVHKQVQRHREHIICVPRKPQATLISSTPQEMRTATV